MTFRIILLTASASMMNAPAAAEDSFDLGFIASFSGGIAVVGNDMRAGVELARGHIDDKVGPLTLEVKYVDDKGPGDPSIGKQATEELVVRDDVDMVAGYQWSNVLLASAQIVLGAGKFLVTSNAGPSQLAGELCHENFFSTSWQNDQPAMALGEALNERGVQSVYLMAPNYAAGKNVVAGIERAFRGTIAGKDMTTWPDQIDFSSEFAKAKATDAEGVAFFYPGMHTGAFVTQFIQAGLNDRMHLYSVFSIDSLSLPRFQEANTSGILGSYTAGFWSPLWSDGLALDNEQNRRFVGDYKLEHGKYPSHYAAQSYDMVFMIRHAVEAVDGDLDDMDGMRAAMASADWPSVRGDFAYGKNHMPIQDFYLREVVADADGVWTTKATKTVLQDHQDSYAGNCAM